MSEAESGVKALQCVAANPPTLILLDLMLPDMTGLEFIAKLRENEKWREIPVVVVTNLDPLSLDDKERDYLYQQSEELMLKGDYNRDEFLRQINRHVAACIQKRDAAGKEKTSAESESPAR